MTAVMTFIPLAGETSKRILQEIGGGEAQAMKCFAVAGGDG
jgi:hypothetical protein